MFIIHFVLAIGIFTVAVTLLATAAEAAQGKNIETAAQRKKRLEADQVIWDRVHKKEY